MAMNTKDDPLLNFGLINIDKPSGPTSYQVSNYLKEQLGIKKTSHMGTLDPKVTGVLPITLGRACKLANYFITHDKTYIGVLQTHKPQNLKELQKIINKHFVGDIKQTPPHRSAVKRTERTRKVHYFNLTETDEENKNFVFETKVQGGTYIRKICSDLGEQIGGAHMAELRRTKAGIYNEETNMVSLKEFDEALQEYKKGKTKKLHDMITPATDALLQVMNKIEVKKQFLKALLNGKPLFNKEINTEQKKLTKTKKEERFAVFNEKQFIGVYKKTKEKNVYARPEFVYTKE